MKLQRRELLTVRRVSWLRLWRRGRCRRYTRDISDHGVRGSRMAIVPLRFDERMVYQQGGALQVLRLARVTGECSSIHSS